MEQKHRDIIFNNLEVLIKLTSFEPIFESLIEKKIFSPLMIEKIRKEKNDIEQKKTMYTMITRRGPLAFEILCQVLKDTGHDDLIDRLNKTALDSSSECLPESRESRNTDVYQMSSNPRGHMLLININNFSNDTDTREGSEFDEKRLKVVWKYLGYEMIIHNKLNKEEFENEIRNFTKIEKHGDSAVVFILTHGTPSSKNDILINFKCSDHRLVSSEWILDQFTVNNCPQLEGKPKLFFFGACRGVLPTSDRPKHNENELSIGSIDGVIDDEPRVQKQNRQNKSDMLIVYSTAPGFASPREAEGGTIFAQILCDVLSTQANENDLRSMLQEVARKMSLHNVSLCESFCRFDKKLYFNPLN